MSVRKILAYSFIIAGIAAGSASAALDVGIDVGVAPPPPQVEAVPAVAPGYVWAPGYWDYQGGHHVWVAGHRIPDRPGHHYVADKWVQHGNQWHHDRGHWE